MSTVTSNLSAQLKRRLLLAMLESRLGDLREESLNRQGKGHFHVSGRGHEALAAIGVQLTAEDYLAPYYRDRGLMIGRGLTTRQMALDYYAKRDSSSGGRQMPSHYSNRELNIWSVPTPTASQLLPACGIAWGLKMDKKTGVVVTTLGDASTRQGDFYEAICFAQERRLPVLFIVEDNGFGISTPTRGMTPRALGVLAEEQWRVIEGWDVEQVHAAGQEAIADLRAGRGPVLLWAKMERLSSHTSSDDHAIYRSKADLATLDQRDPLKNLKAQLIAEGELTEEEFAKLEKEVKEKVRADYAQAEKADEPEAAELENNIWSPPPHLDDEVLKPGKYRIGDVVNLTLRAALKSDGRRVIFGEDVEDPKGGVFRLTQKLSTDFPEQVFNSPLAESTILGVACGLASYGKRPVFEVQFIDFIYPGWNQLVTNLATLRWRSNGQWTCPVVIYAPYGAYLPGGAIWHSQANEAPLTHFPGVSVVIPSTPEDAAGLLWTAMHADDPVIFLVPKHMLWAETTLAEPAMAVPIGHARRRTEGHDVTLVGWGNTVEKALEAMDLMGEQVSVELIDLRSIVPWDRETIEDSVRKTGRLVIVQEDTENCSVGQMIISHIAGRADVWSRLVSPPVLVSKGNVMIGYNPILEYAALPDTARIAEALQRVMSITMERGAVSSAAAILPAAVTNRPTVSTSAPAHGSVETVPGAITDIPVKVPIMGEGIRSARVVTLHKKAGDTVNLDDTLCEVETDKAVYPIEASFEGMFKEWKVKVDETVEIGQEIALITGTASAAASAPAAHGSTPPAPKKAAAPANARPAGASGAANGGAASVKGELREPALSLSITKRLSTVVPANVQIDATWKAIRSAREAAKAAKLDYSPSLMLAWSVVRAMTTQAGFRCIVDRDGRIFEQSPFDLGVAVALEGDRLATAVVSNASALGWKDFAAAYVQAIADTRAGKVVDVQAPLNLTSLGAFGIEQATPIVVPPAMATLFVGTAHEKMVNDGGVVYPQEVVTLSLTFDHRVVNGAGAAAFMHELRETIGNFKLPA